MSCTDDVPGVLIHANMHFHPVGQAFRAAVLPRLAFVGLMPLRILLPLLGLVPAASVRRSL
jgi:hypothetical protein